MDFNTPPERDGLPSNDAWKTARRYMVALLQSRGIGDPGVLQAMTAVPRHAFIPGEPPGPNVAYGDYPLPIGQGQTISQPYIVAYMTQQLDVQTDHQVLEIGSGCGYQAAILAEMGAMVTGIEIQPLLMNHAREVLQRLGYHSIRLIQGNGYDDLPDETAFDRIIVSCAPPTLPMQLVDRLADSGRMIVPVGVSQQALTIVERHGAHICQVKDLPVRFVPMIPNDSTHKP